MQDVLPKASTSSQHVLIVGADHAAKGALRDRLANHGILTIVASGAINALSLLQSHEIDVVVTPLELPGSSIIELLQLIRRDSSVAVIVIGVPADDATHVTGLAFCDVDFMPSRSSPAVIAAKVGAVVQRLGTPRGIEDPTSPIKREILVFEGWRLDTKGLKLSAPDGQRVDLTSTECQVLSCLAENARVTKSREEITRAVHGADYAHDDTTIVSIVAKLREKLSVHPHGDKLVTTVRNKGYVFSLPVAWDA